MAKPGSDHGPCSAKAQALSQPAPTHLHAGLLQSWILLGGKAGRWGQGAGGGSQLRGVWGAEQVTFPGLLFTLSPRLSPAQFHSLLSELSSYISSEPSSRSIFFISPGWECCGHQGLRSGSSRKALSSTPTLLHNPPLSRRPPSASLPSRSLPVFIFLGWGSLPAPLSCSLLQELEPPAPSGPPH